MSSLRNNNSEQYVLTVYTFQDQPFRVVGSIETPSFVVKDICNILEISNPTMAVRSIPEEWRGDLNQIEDSSGHTQHMLTVKEPGLYQLIMRSDKPIAKRFQKWVCEDVLPSIRKSGEYVLKEYKARIEAQQQLLAEKEELLDEKEEMLLNQSRSIKRLENRVVRQQTRENFPEKNVVYLITSRYHQPERIYIIGKALDLKERLSDYNKSVEHDVVYYRGCNSAKQMNHIEKCVLFKLDKYRVVSNRDRFILPENRDISLFTNIFDLFVDAFNDVDESVDVNRSSEEEKRQREIEYRADNKGFIKDYKQNYYDEHKDEILEKTNSYYHDNREKVLLNQKEYREENKEHIKEQSKQFRDEHKDQISKKSKNYYDENKEQIKEKSRLFYEEHKEEANIGSKIYREEHKEELAEKKHQYYEEHKDEIKENVKKYYEEHKQEVAAYKKEYAEKNKEIIKEKDRLKYLKNKEKLRLNARERVICECGLEVSKASLNGHKKSQTHLRFLKRNEEQTEVEVNKKVVCECGINVNCENMEKHKMTKIHERILERKNK